jgi:hypothetical protein
MTQKYINQFPLFLCLVALGLSNTSILDAQTVKAINQEKAKSENDKTQFLRVVDDRNDEPIAMQTAITRYRPEQGALVVDLIGAVHVGEADYYEQLNRQFEVYDVVLYELVAPAGTRVPAGGQRARASRGPLDLVGWMQNQAKSSLGLESQLDKIDYQKSNLLHADMSPADISKKMAERGDSALTIGLSAMSEILRQQNLAAQSADNREMINEFANEGIFELLNNPLKLKRMMAGQFADSGVMEMGLGQTLNQLLITDRNEAAVKVLQKEIAAGKKKIAIFYGAAHMPNFEKQLTEDFGLNKTKQVWVDAWDLTKAGTKTSNNSPTDMMFRLLNELGK